MINNAQIWLILANCSQIYGQKLQNLWPDEIVVIVMANQLLHHQNLILTQSMAKGNLNNGILHGHREYQIFMLIYFLISIHDT